MRKTNTIFSLLLLALGWFVLSPATEAVVPPPDGGYPGGNTAEGQKALFSLTTGTFNTAVGFSSLRSNTEGGFNTGVGAGALLSNNSGRNTATGAAALLSNTTGPANTANGAFALLSNTEGGYNTAVGDRALLSHTAGDRNTAIGASALLNDITGTQNTAIGAAVLLNNTTGYENTAMGDDALAANTTGTHNTAIGDSALTNATARFNTAVGYSALLFNSTGEHNTAIGINAGVGVTTASNVICIGSNVDGENVSDTTWIGNIYSVTTQSGTTASVIVSDSGQLGTVASSARFKKDIATMDAASAAILSLRPVTFHYKSDAKGVPQFGLIAEEVAKVNPALVLLDKEGKPYTVRYEAVNAMLLNEFLKEHKTVQEQAAMIAGLKKEIETVVARLKEQDSKIQRVTARTELSEAVARTALNNP